MTPFSSNVVLQRSVRLEAPYYVASSNLATRLTTLSETLFLLGLLLFRARYYKLHEQERIFAHPQIEFKTVHLFRANLQDDEVLK